MTKIKLSKLSRLNRMYIKEYLQECGLDCLDIELRNEEEFADEITVCNFDVELKNKLSESGIVYDDYCLKTHLDIKLYEDIKNNVVQSKYARSIGYLYLVQDNNTYEVDVECITKVEDDEVPQITPKRFVLVRGFNVKHYLVYDEIEDVYYWTSDVLNEKLEKRGTEKERIELILEDTSWFVEKDIFPEDWDL